MEPAPGTFLTEELDWQVDAAEAAGKQVILGVGALKNFSYPEFFVPRHHLPRPLPEGTLVEPTSHPSLLAAAAGFLRRVVHRYRDREAIIAWQVEHEAVDPLGAEHSWRLSASWVEAELAVVRDLDPTRPIMLNGFLPTSLPVRLQQWWRTRDQGDSLSVAQRLADIVGIDYYPGTGSSRLGSRSLYLDGSMAPWQASPRRDLLAWARPPGRRLMVSEGQAEPWETVTVPPDPAGRGMYSCMPEQVIENYNRWMRWARQETAPLHAYLFWGAEYWVLRAQGGDTSYLGAFSRILESA